jgi:hypothetical protein
MAIIDYTTTNSYPLIKRVAITTAAQEFTLPKACTAVTFGSTIALYYANIGDDGDAFTSAITDFSFVPANNLVSLRMKKGNDSSRKLLIGSQTGSGHVSIIIESE